MHKKEAPAGRVHPLLDRELRPFLHQVFNEPGFGECTQLCDVGTVERVCEMIPDAFEVAGMGHDPNLLPLLMSNLYEPLFRFAQESERWAQEKREERSAQGLGGSFLVQELEATVLFMDQLDEIFEWLREGPWSDEGARRCESLLRSSWYRWIAHIASPFITYKVPLAKARARQHGAKSNDQGQAGRKSKYDRDKICADHADLFPSRGSAAAGIVATRHGCTADYVRKLLKQRNATKPAG